MSEGMRVTAVGPDWVNAVFDHVQANLPGDAHFVRYHEISELTADENVLATTEILLIPGFVPCGHDVMAAAPRLRALVSPFTGTEGIDEKAASDLGILVANSQAPEHFGSLAEATVLLMLAALYDLHGAEAALRDETKASPPGRGRMLRGRSIGLIGFGNIARTVADRLSTWEARIQTYTPRLKQPLPESVKRVELDELLKSSDVVSVHCALNAETRGLLDARRLRLLKPDAILVNTARGPIIDEEALYEVARDNPRMTIALDVFATEPLPADSPLRGLPNAILTPHRIGHTADAAEAIPRTAAENVLRALRGEAPLYLRNPEILEEWRRRWGN